MNQQNNQTSSEELLEELIELTKTYSLANRMVHLNKLRARKIIKKILLG